MKVSQLCRITSLLTLSALAACGDSDRPRGPDAGDAAAEAGGDQEKDAGLDSGDDAPTIVPPEECPTISFVTPAANAALNEADDKDKDACSNGFQYDVSVATSAADGTPASLFAGSALLAEGAVSGALVKFSGVQLSAKGPSSLKVQVGGTKCVAERFVSVECRVPTCDVVKPVLSAAHPRLNGIPVANGGDRVSSSGSPYQVAVEVTTSVEDGQPVLLAVDGSPVQLTTTAQAGKANFPGLTLAPDATYTLVATCRAKSGAIGTSAKGMYPVDSEGPQLGITQPADGTHFEKVPTFQVCATSTSGDARDLPSESAPGGGKNLCASVGAAAPVCAAMVSAGSTGQGCVDVTCPGGPAFDLSVSLRDSAGNSTSKVISGITCRTNLPAVEIVSPSSTIDGDPTTRVLAANATQARKDAAPNLAGAQYTVVVCTEVENGSVSLTAGLAGQALGQIETTRTAVPAVQADGCPVGKPYAARFVSATLPESQETSTGALQKATRLVASVTDVSNTKGESLPVDLWVDSAPPALAASAALPLCGAVLQSAVAVAPEISFTTSVLPLSVTFTKPGAIVEVRTTNSYSLGLTATLGNVTFPPGETHIAASVIEPSGNRAALADPCVLTVGNLPRVSWLAPTATDRLGASSDADTNLPGWQGTLRVHTDVGSLSPATTVTFTATPGGILGTATVDASGDATLNNVTLADGSVQLLATTSDVTDRGVGRANIVVPVDTTTPSAITAVSWSVPADKRRQSTFHLAWTVPSDTGGGISGYDVRVSTSPITDLAAFNSAEAVAYVGVPAAGGQTDGVDVANRYIEHDYYFAVAALDAGGNRSMFTATGPGRATFERVMLRGSGATNEAYGRFLDATQSINGDSYADLIVAGGATSGSSAHIYLGGPSGLANRTGDVVTPSVTISGTPATRFGASVRVVGDIDGDGLPELAVSALSAPSGALLTGSVFIFKGRTVWPPTLNQGEASYVITGSSDIAAFSGAEIGSYLARLGDFDGDGHDDFAVSASRFDGNRGLVAIIRGVSNQETFPASLTLGVADARIIELQGATGTTGRFGWQVSSLANFYGGAGTTLMVSATVETALAGRVYAFTPARLNTNSPLDATAAALANDSLGYAIAPLGLLGSPMALALSAPRYTSGSGFVQIHRGTTNTGPFVDAPVIITNTAAAALSNAFGACTFGSIQSGVPQSVVDSRNSFLGSSQPDLAVSGFAEGSGAARLYLVDGQKIPSLTSGDIADIADGSLSLPNDWVGGLGCGPSSQGIPDLNHDGYADIALSQFQRLGDYAGGVLVLW